MCGIAGIIWKRDTPEAASRLQSMVDRVAHRGPDGRGVWSDGAVSLGHARLAIIDPAGGAQPMTSADGRLAITLNGEIYNFRELRNDLERLGHEFLTRSDTEVVLASYRQWGPVCVTRFRGMFAFALADADNHRVLLARDHLGIKPLLYFDSPTCFGFASEMQSLRELTGSALDLDLDLEALDDYLHLGYVPAPRTALRGVCKLRPGHTLSLSWAGICGQPRAYWRPEFRPDHSRSEDEWVESLDEVLRQSVRAHLVADVPFGMFLSGGLDSAAVLAYMAQILDRPVTAFTVGFAGGEQDEVADASEAAERWDAEHIVARLEPDALAILPDLVRHYGEPFADSSAVPTYSLAQMAAAHVPMVLSGDGGDELFAGYNTYSGWMAWLQWHGRPPWRRLLYPLARRIRPRRYLPRKAELEPWLRFVHPDAWRVREELWRPELLPDTARMPAALVEASQHIAGLSPVQMAQQLDLTGYLPDDILTKVDVASMMHGLEVRTPMVDREVVDFVTTIPENVNIRRRADGLWEGKLLLKRLLSRYYPDTVSRRPKRGFAAPLPQWLGAGHESSEAIRNRLVDRTSPLQKLLQPSGIDAVARSDKPFWVWRLLVLDEWLRQLDEAPDPAPIYSGGRQC